MYHNINYILSISLLLYSPPGAREGQPLLVDGLPPNRGEQFRARVHGRNQHEEGQEDVHRARACPLHHRGRVVYGEPRPGGPGPNLCVDMSQPDFVLCREQEVRQRADEEAQEAYRDRVVLDHVIGGLVAYLDVEEHAAPPLHGEKQRYESVQNVHSYECFYKFGVRLPDACSGGEFGQLHALHFSTFVYYFTWLSTRFITEYNKFVPSSLLPRSDHQHSQMDLLSGFVNYRIFL